MVENRTCRGLRHNEWLCMECRPWNYFQMLLIAAATTRLESALGDFVHRGSTFPYDNNFIYLFVLEGEKLLTINLHVI